MLAFIVVPSELLRFCQCTYAPNLILMYTVQKYCPGDREMVESEDSSQCKGLTVIPKFLHKVSTKLSHGLFSTCVSYQSKES